MRDDFADIINPIGRMEREAEQRGYRRGILTALWWLLCAVVAGMVLYSLKAHAAWDYEESRRVIKASERNARISICQQNAVEMGWACFTVR